MSVLTKYARCLRDQVCDLARMMRPRNLTEALNMQRRRPRERPPAQDRETALKEAVMWLLRSQEAGSDDGSSCYSLETGWSSGYPEVTGYNLYTLLDYYEATDCCSVRQHAMRMADWLLGTQFENGAFPGSYVSNNEQKPTVFNTAQVLQGLFRAHLVSGDMTFRESAIRAADWLLAVQDEDGAWRRHAYLDVFRVTDSRIAYPLAELGQSLGSSKYTKAAKKSVDHILKLQYTNGWFPECDNSLWLVDQPITHTLNYTCEGILKCGILLENEAYIEGAKRTAVAMLYRFEDDKVLYGRYDASWRPTVPWACLTGCAQMSEIWSLLFQEIRDSRYLNAAIKINDYLCACQDVQNKNPGIRGALSGSEPLGGRYQSFTYPSWATKYFVDALMAEQAAKEKRWPQEELENT